jgi:pyruvate formate lyase activating enzyme
MKFGGFQKTSLIDFPGKISSILFTTGCNLRCPYCYNWRLVVEPRPPFLSEEDAFKILESRKKYVDAVVITGGEPTLSEDLPSFVKKLNEKKFSVKLDTNGFFPHILERCLPYLKYAAVDIKTSLEKYTLLGGEGTDSFLRSIELLKEGRVDYEFRNTVVPGLVNEEDIPKLGEMVKFAKRFVFQEFVPGETLDEQFNKVKPYSPEVIARFAEVMKNYVDEVTLRI